MRTATSPCAHSACSLYLVRAQCAQCLVLCALSVLGTLYLVRAQCAQCELVTAAIQRRQRMYNRRPKPTNAEENHSATIRHIHRARHRDQSSAPNFQVRCRLATVRETSTATKHHVYLRTHIHRHLHQGRRRRTTGQRWKSRRSGGQSRTAYVCAALLPPPSPISELT